MKKKFPGTIKTLVQDRRFGFIAVRGSPKDLFFHSSSLEGLTFEELSVGDAVGFAIEEGPKGVGAVSVERDGPAWAESSSLEEALTGSRDFWQAGLVDSEGVPLSRDSEESKQVSIDISGVNENLLAILHEHPELMRELTSRRFEEVVADLLAKLGYEVNITPASGDGGFDIYAAQKTALGRFLFLVECKKYSPTNKVGVEIVRSLHGVVQDSRATAGVVVTTSFFTRGAEEFQRRNRHHLHLRDYLGLRDWLRQALGK
jgi:cold shock CspA family protein